MRAARKSRSSLRRSGAGTSGCRTRARDAAGKISSPTRLPEARGNCARWRTARDRRPDRDGGAREAARPARPSSSDGDHPFDAELGDQRGRVVGAIGEPEASAQPDPAAMAAIVESDHPVVAAEGVEHRVQLSAAVSAQTVQEQHDRRSGRSGDFTDPSRPALRSSTLRPAGTPGQFGAVDTRDL